MSKSKSPWFLAVICRFLAVICGSLSVSVGSWRLYVGSWRSSAVPGGYLVLGVLLSCSGQLIKMQDFCTKMKFPPLYTVVYVFETVEEEGGQPPVAQ